MNRKEIDKRCYENQKKRGLFHKTFVLKKDEIEKVKEFIKKMRAEK